MLDCRTPRGRRAINEQYSTQRILELLGFTCVSTGEEDHPSDIILARKRGDQLVIHGIAEIKSRYAAGDQVLTVDYLKKDGYLITFDKIRKGVQAAQALRTAFFVIVRLIGDGDKILVWKVWDRGYLVPIFNKKTTTQKTINGGTADRVNTFLPISKATILEGNSTRTTV